MKAITVQNAINFALNDPKTRKYIYEMEAPPPAFEIYEISGVVIDPRNMVVRVLINFREFSGVNNFKEDVLIDLQPVGPSGFKILRVTSTQVYP